MKDLLDINSVLFNRLQYTAIGISLAWFGTASAKILLENADIAMYQAKARRDGSYQFFEPATLPLRD